MGFLSLSTALDILDPGSFRNPYPGRMYDTPDISKEVYEGVKIDYRGKAVNVRNILSVLSGNKSAVLGGSGRVIERYPDKAKSPLQLKPS